MTEQTSSDKLAFRRQQAAKAKEFIADETMDDLARKVAIAIIEAFPDIKRGDRKRTDAAEQVAVSGLTLDQLMRTATVRTGINRARHALKKAYRTLDWARNH